MSGIRNINRLIFAPLAATFMLAISGCAVIPRAGSTVASVPDPAPSPAASATTPPVQPPAAQPIAAAPVPPPVGGTAIRAASDETRASGRPLRAGPPVAQLTMSATDAAGALASFQTSCSALIRREDRSGLTSPADWQPACTAAASATPATARAFFAAHFETVELDGGASFVTGYYEPEIAGARQQGGIYQTPVYRRPPDIVEADLTPFADDLKGRRIRGRVEDGRLVPYWDRAAIDAGALAGKGLELAWAADPVEFFFLQVQGSGRLIAADGSVIRIGYDGQNGREYVGIGAKLRERGLLAPGQASMQGIMDWIHANPAEGRALMQENKSFIFFRELTGPGPLGALGLPVVAESSVAADPSFIPLGAPVWLAMDRAEPNGMWIAQDTGGAIKGPNRFDSFWGAGDRARAVAGGMSARGQALILLPKGSFARLSRNATTVPASPATPTP